MLALPKRKDKTCSAEPNKLMEVCEAYADSCCSHLQGLMEMYGTDRLLVREAEQLNEV